MYEIIEQQGLEQRNLFDAVCQSFGSANVVGLLVTCFGKEATGRALDTLGVLPAMPGTQLVDIYERNRNFVDKGGEND